MGCRRPRAGAVKTKMKKFLLQCFRGKVIIIKLFEQRLKHTTGCGAVW